MEFESSHYVSSRLGVWCPVCGAAQGQGCKPVGGLRFSAHDAYALGQVPKPVVQMEPVTYRTQAPANRPKWTPQRWQQ